MRYLWYIIITVSVRLWVKQHFLFFCFFTEPKVTTAIAFNFITLVLFVSLVLSAITLITNKNFECYQSCRFRSIIFNSIVSRFFKNVCLRKIVRHKIHLFYLYLNLHDSPFAGFYVFVLSFVFVICFPSLNPLKRVIASCNLFELTSLNFENVWRKLHKAAKYKNYKKKIKKYLS